MNYRYQRHCSWSAIIVFVITVSLSATAMAEVEFTNLGTLPDHHSSFALGLSPDSNYVVGGNIGSTNTVSAFRWNATTGMQDLGALVPGDSTNAYSVSGSGGVVVGDSFSEDPSSFGYLSRQAYRWTETTGMQGLGFLEGYEFSTALGISGDGSTIVGYVENSLGQSKAVSWNDTSGPQLLNALPTDANSGATAISSDGQYIIGDYSTGTSDQAFRWSATEGLFVIEAPTGFISPEANNISANGAFVVGEVTVASEFALQPFLWSETGGMQVLDVLPGTFIATATGVTADGSIVIGNNFGGLTEGAFIWTEAGGAQLLSDYLETVYGIDLNGWSLDFADAISADGTVIVGSGTNPFGELEAWHIDLAAIPVPPALWLMVTGLIGLVATARRNKRQS